MERDHLVPSHQPSSCLLTQHLAELTCTVSMTMEKEWSWQSRANRYWQTPLKVKYLSSKLLKWDCPVTRHSPAGAQRKRGEQEEWSSRDGSLTMSSTRKLSQAPFLKLFDHSFQPHFIKGATKGSDRAILSQWQSWDQNLQLLAPNSPQFPVPPHSCSHRFWLHWGPLPGACRVLSPGRGPSLQRHCRGSRTRPHLGESPKASGQKG